MDKILTVEDLHVSYGRIRVLKNLTFDVYTDEVLGIIGPNGAGKTTLLNALTGNVKPVQGRIAYNGADITNMSVSKRCHVGIGRTFQIPQTFENLTVYENVLVSSVHGAGLSEKQGVEKSFEALKLTDTYDLKDQMAGKLNLLDRKRLEMAKAYATNPKLMLLDEVGAGLVESEIDKVMGIVREINGLGITIIWIEHIIVTMLKATDRLLCLAEGTQIKCGLPQDVIASKEVEDVYLGVEED